MSNPSPTVDDSNSTVGAPPGPASSRLVRRLLDKLLTIPLRFKITIPYLVIALLLAGLAAWLVSQTFAKALQERFRGQLAENAIVANQALFQIELDQLAGARAIARTSGVAEALLAHNWDALDNIIRPLAVNSRLSLVHIIDHRGLPVYGIRAVPEGFAENENAEFVTWEPVQHVLRGERDDLGDKYVDVVDAPWGAALYTAGPVKQGDTVIGVVMVGTPLAEALDTVRGSEQTQITLFQPDGGVVFTTFGRDQLLASLDSGLIQSVTAGGATEMQTRLLTIGQQEYNEALGNLVLRGQLTGWMVGVALPRTAFTDQLSPTEIAGWFTLGVLAIIGLGVLVAQLVAVPVTDLVQASSRVAEGDLSVEVPERAKDELGLLAQRFNWMVHELRKRETMHEVFGQVVSAEVREALLSGKVGLGGELKVVSVLFTDIRDFTSLAEKYDPQEVVRLLNDYFEVISDAVSKSGGLINKFGGDSTMAIFGAPIALPPGESAHRALKAAFAIRTRLAEFNARQIERNQSPIRIGIGINTGEVVTGNIGSRNRFEYTVIGDTVNVAARVQSLTNRFTDSNILFTEDTLHALGKEAKLLVIDHGDVTLKGKSKPVRVYGVIGMRLTEAEPLFQVGGIPRRDVLESLYLYCRGFSVRTISLTKNIDPLVIHQWVEGAARMFDRASMELREEFGLIDAELHRLSFGVRRMAELGPESMVTQVADQPGKRDALGQQ
ncbi:MAG TPA: adenylate/guanylate cyclase domain-containing protein [Anaerolineales bacterium]|nr:adenylate/guanylate cyclase domain-containing protein [Anaerolineales bacterium]